MLNNSLLPNGLQWAGPLLSPFYGLGVAAHRALTAKKTAPLPVLCIGNLTVGGTGKTPAAKYFARGLNERGHKPAVLMRGYKEQASDEACEVENAVKSFGIPVLIGGDRYASACKAKELGRDCVLLDDGFQHWRLARDLDIVLIDSTNPFGGERLIPSGRLREPLEGLKRAGIVILTRCDLSTEEELSALESRVNALAPGAILARAIHGSPQVKLLDCYGKATDDYRGLHGARIVAACGIGNPEAFRATLGKLGAEIVDFVGLPDHYKFDILSLSGLLEKTAAAGAKALVVTEKDEVKIKQIYGSIRKTDKLEIWALQVHFNIIRNEIELWNRVKDALHSKKSK